MTRPNNIGRYEIIREVGRGGMGIVYEARDPQLNRRIALKVLPPELTYDRRFVERFLREGRLAASLSHPNIVTVYEAGEADGKYFLAMEFIDGTDLAHLIQEKAPLELDLALEILGQVAAGLDAAHAKGIVHRDIKPENVLLDVKGVAKVADFGIARAQDEAGGTRTGTVIGTAEYISPEQALGKQVGPASDIYSLACVAYELLTGTPPFGQAGDQRSPISIITSHASQQPVHAHQVQSRLSRGTGFALMAALDKDPGNRPKSASGLVLKLREGVSPPISRRAMLAWGTAAVITVPAAWIMASTLRKRPRSGALQTASAGPVSPDTTPRSYTLAFVRDGNLYIRNDGMQEPQLAARENIATFAWSPDGERLALIPGRYAEGMDQTGLVLLDLRKSTVETVKAVLVPDSFRQGAMPLRDEWRLTSVTWLDEDTLGFTFQYLRADHGITRSLLRYDLGSAACEDYLSGGGFDERVQQLKDPRGLAAHPSLPGLVAHVGDDTSQSWLVVSGDPAGGTHTSPLGYIKKHSTSFPSNQLTDVALAWHPGRPILAIGLEDRVLVAAAPDWEPTAFDADALDEGSSFCCPAWSPHAQAQWLPSDPYLLINRQTELETEKNSVAIYSYPEGGTVDLSETFTGLRPCWGASLTKLQAPSNPSTVFAFL